MADMSGHKKKARYIIVEHLPRPAETTNVREILRCKYTTKYSRGKFFVRKKWPKNTPAGTGRGACPALADGVKLNKAESDRVGGPADAVGQIAEGSFKLFGFVGGKAAGAAVAVDAVELMVKPRTRLAEISSRNFAP